MLSKCKGLSAVQLGTLLNLAQAALAGELVLLGTHLHIVLRVAQRAVLCEEGTVTAVQNVQVGVCKMGIGIDINSSVVVADEFRHDRCAVRGIFTVQNQSGARLHRAEQLTGKLVLVIKIEGTVDMAALILVLESAIDNHDMVEPVIELPIQKLDECALVDARQVVRLFLGDEVRKLKAWRTFHVTDRLDGCICRYLGLFFGDHISRVLKHTQ